MFSETYSHHSKQQVFIERIHRDRRNKPRDELYSYINKLYRKGYLLIGYFSTLEGYFQKALHLLDPQARTSRKTLGQLLGIAKTEYKLPLLNETSNNLLSEWNNIKHSNLTETSEYEYQEILKIEENIYEFMLHSNLEIARRIFFYSKTESTTS